MIELQNQTLTAVKSHLLVDELFDGSRLPKSNITDVDWGEMEQILNGFSATTFSTLNTKFHDEVDEPPKFYAILAEIRFANVIRSADPTLLFVRRQAAPTPDISATISSSAVDFEVSRLVESFAITGTRLDKIVNTLLRLQERRGVAPLGEVIVLLLVANWVSYAFLIGLSDDVFKPSV